MIRYIKWLLLLMPIVIERIDDKKSDKDKKQDIYKRALYIVLFGLLDSLLGLTIGQEFLKQWFKAAALSFGLFVFLFDSVMAKTYRKPVNYLGTTSKWDLFVSKLHPWVLWGIKGVILIITIIIYIW